MLWVPDKKGTYQTINESKTIALNTHTYKHPTFTELRAADRANLHCKEELTQGTSLKIPTSLWLCECSVWLSATDPLTLIGHEKAHCPDKESLLLVLDL
jgi:hypothetical protein